MDDIESLMLLSQVETWLTELEREVRAFEAAVAQADEAMDDVEEMEVVAYAGESDNAGGEIQQDLQQLERALEATERIAQLVHAADSALSEAIATVYQSLESAPAVPDTGIMPDFATTRYGDPDMPLAEGSLILGGRYRLVRLLHQRPRLNLYLARRQYTGMEAGASEEEEPGDERPLVAIRELVLTGLSPQMRRQVERAAFEEFVSPMMLGSAHLPGAGDRVRVEGERHYLVMQLRRTKGERPALAVTLAELLSYPGSQRQWPAWLDLETALEWGLQLCRVVARLHRSGTVLGDLDPATVLVDSEGPAQWAPVLLISWPPSPQFWQKSAGSVADAGSAVGLPAVERSRRIFPAAHLSANQAFAAPEMLNGLCDQRSDVYSLGAILYLLLTRYAPATAASRMRAAYRNAHSEDRIYHGGSIEAEQRREAGRGGETRRGPGLPLLYMRDGDGRHNGFVPQAGAGGMALIAPHLFNYHIPQALEHVLLRALALDPGERYSTVPELLEALESEQVRLSLVEATAPADDARGASRVGRVVEWLKRELEMNE